MKKITLIITLCAWVIFAPFAKPQQPHAVKQKQDTVRDIKDQPKPRVVKGRRERMRMQLKQIKFHEKQVKKAHQAQQELRKERGKKESD